MPTSPRYQPVEDDREPQSHRNDREEDYFGDVIHNPIRGERAPTYQSNPEGENIPLTYLSPPEDEDDHTASRSVHRTSMLTLCSAKSLRHANLYIF
jgi:hypothetical protein